MYSIRICINALVCISSFVEILILFLMKYTCLLAARISHMFTRMLFLCQHTSLLEESKLQVRLKEWNLPANTISLVDAQTDIFIFIQYCGKETDFQFFHILFKVFWWQRKSFSRIKYQTTVEEGLYFM